MGSWLLEEEEQTGEVNAMNTTFANLLGCVDFGNPPVDGDAPVGAEDEKWWTIAYLRQDGEVMSLGEASIFDWDSRASKVRTRPSVAQ